MRKLVRIKSNIKSPGGAPWEHELGDYNLLLGPNESGKSAVAEAIQLALTGSAYGLFFRNAQVKAGNQLSELGAIDTVDLYAHAVFDDGTTSEWNMAAGKRPTLTGTGGETLPIGELRTALAGSAQKARAFFLARLLPAGVSRLDIEKLLKHPSHDLSIPLEVLIPDVGRPIAGESLVAALSEAGTWKRNAKSDAKAAQDLLTTLSLASEHDSEELYATYENLAKALCFEWLKKLHKDPEVDYDKGALTKMALNLGEKAELKGLKGSAQYSEDLEHILGNKRLLENAKSLRNQVQQHEKTAAEYDALIKALDKACTALLTQPLIEYTKRVNKFLPQGDKFGLDHSEREFKIYLQRGKQRHAALSGSTEIRTLAAMAAALPVGDDSIVIILDDRMWDADTLSKTLDKLQTAACQVVVMTTIPPAGEQKNAWSYIEISNEARKEKTGEKAVDLPPVQATAGGQDEIPW